MATQFEDVKPWPKQADDNARVAIGDNRPPLEESVVLDFEEALRSGDGLIARIEAMEAKAADVKPCASADSAGRMGDFIKMTSAAAKIVEEEREKFNRPILTAQRSLKARADSYSQRALAAGAKVRVELDKFLAAEEAKRRAEAARIAEEERQAAAERQRIIDEANKQAAAEAEAERVRLQAIEDERAAKEQREAAVVEVEPEPVFVAEPFAPQFASAAPAKAPLRGDYGTSVSTVETWDVEVENIRQVPDAYLKHPTVIEALEKVIRPQVRGKSGIREIKGCRIFSKLGSAVR
jgi:flagellar biosynthesis GTPase FlhF